MKLENIKSVRRVSGPPQAVFQDSDVSQLSSGPGRTVYAIDSDNRSRAIQLASYTYNDKIAKIIHLALGIASILEKAGIDAEDVFEKAYRAVS